MAENQIEIWLAPIEREVIARGGQRRGSETDALYAGNASGAPLQVELFGNHKED
jgi:hypothetical protein